jgi:hypothetical protein
MAEWEVIWSAPAESRFIGTTTALWISGHREFDGHRDLDGQSIMSTMSTQSTR